MKKLLALLFLAGLATGCATAGYPLAQMPPAYPPYPPYPGRSQIGPPLGPAVSYPLPAPPIGRWDNVMMLAAGTPVQVLLMDGGVAHGPVRHADSTSLTLRVASGDVELDAARVMRVDRLAAPQSAVKDGAKGAAFGAGVVGVIGLIAGKVPPARVFAAGGIIGAYNNVEVGATARNNVIIYLAREAAPNARGGAQLAPRAVTYPR
jgi:hypothetical protein